VALISSGLKVPDDAVIPRPDLDDRLEVLLARAQASQARAEELHAIATRAVTASGALRSRTAGLPGSPADFPKATLQASRYARLLARLATLPVIEQAKGIMMAQTGCTPDEAFDMLRRASQRSNIPVRELAEQIIERTTASAAEAAERAG
jgi:hypothetical protein